MSFSRLRGQCAGLEWEKALIGFKKEKDNIEKRETLRLNLNNNEFTSISIQM